jgi:hypothetical protein
MVLLTSIVRSQPGELVSHGMFKYSPNKALTSLRGTPPVPDVTCVRSHRLLRYILDMLAST